MKVKNLSLSIPLSLSLSLSIPISLSLSLSLTHTNTHRVSETSHFIYRNAGRCGKVWIPYKTQAACSGKSRRPFYPVTLAALQAWAGELKIYLR